MAALAVLAPEAASWTPGVRGSLRRSVARALAGSGVAASRLRRTRPAPAELRAWTRAPHPELGKREKEAQTRKPQYGKSLSKESFPSIHTLSMPGHRLGLRPSQPEAPAAQNWHQAGKVVAGPRVRALGARAHWLPGAGEAGGKDAGRPAAVSPRPAPRTREAILRARRGAARWLRGHPGRSPRQGPADPLLALVQPRGPRKRNARRALPARSPQTDAPLFITPRPRGATGCRLPAHSQPDPPSRLPGPRSRSRRARLCVSWLLGRKASGKSPPHWAARPG